MFFPEQVGEHETVVAESVDSPCQIHDHGHFHNLKDVDLKSEDRHDAPCVVDVEGFDRTYGDVKRQNRQQAYGNRIAQL